jgi:hypothetical protein
MAIDVEVSRSPVPSPAYGVGELAQRVQVVRTEKGCAVGEREALAAFDFADDFVKDRFV